MSWKRRASKKKINIRQSTHIQFKVAQSESFKATECPLFADSNAAMAATIALGAPAPPTPPPRLSPPIHVTGHAEDRIFNISFAPDGHNLSRLWSTFDATATDEQPKETNQHWIATCGQDGTCRIWCLEYHEKQEQISECYVLPCCPNAECLRMSWGQGLTRDFVATSGADGSIMMWNVRDEQMVQSLTCSSSGSNGKQGEKAEEKPQVYACSLFGGQSTLIMGGYDDRIMIWDVSSGQPVVEWAFSKEGTRTLPPPPAASSSSSSSSSSPSSSSPSSASSLSSLQPSTPQHNPVTDQCFVYGATLGKIQSAPVIAVALSDGSVSIIDPRQATSNVTAYRWKAHTLGVSDVALPMLLNSNETTSTNGTNNTKHSNPWMLTSCSADCLVKVWDLRSITKGPVLSLGGHTKPVFGVECWDEDRIVSWSNDGSLRQWDATGKTSPSVLHTDQNYNLHGCAKKGSYVATCGGTSGSMHQPAYFNLHKRINVTSVL